jgi:hypothetical protein
MQHASAERLLGPARQSLRIDAERADLETVSRLFSGRNEFGPFVLTWIELRVVEAESRLDSWRSRGVEAAKSRTECSVGSDERGVIQVGNLANAPPGLLEVYVILRRPAKQFVVRSDIAQYRRKRPQTRDRPPSILSAGDVHEEAAGPVRKNELSRNEFSATRFLAVRECERHDLPVAQLFRECAEGIADWSNIARDAVEGPVSNVDLLPGGGQSIRQILERFGQRVVHQAFHPAAHSLSADVSLDVIGEEASSEQEHRADHTREQRMIAPECAHIHAQQGR